MNEEEFKKFLPRIRETLRFALDNPYSDFYRQKYRGLDITPEKIKTYADFCQIPFLTKDEILKAPMAKRHFVPQSEVIRYSTSSGTTNSKKPLILPHVKESARYKQSSRTTAPEKELAALGVTKILGLQPAQSFLMVIMTDHDRRIPMFVPDVKRLDLAAIFTKELCPEAIISSPTILYLFTEELKKIGFERNIIKWISLGSELCTKQKFDYFRENYPNAKIAFRFGSSEAGALLGYRCEFIEDEAPQIFHTSKNVMIEIISENTGDESGEMVITQVVKDAFPLIRYRLGDYATLKTTDCPCGEKYIIDTSGKKDLDVLKVAGVTIHTQAVADAIEGISNYVKPDFQIHVFEQKSDGRIMLKLELHLIPISDNVKISDLTQFLQENLYLTSDKTLSDLIKSGHILRLQIKFVKKIERDIKSKNIISHL